MAENRGIAPPDFTTDVGKVRANIGDVTWEEYDPPQPGFGTYRLYSDSEIEAFLAQAEDDPNGATYYIYLAMSAAAAMESKSVKDLDLAVDTTKRSGDLRAIAAMWKDRWDEAVGAGGIFEVFDTVVDGGCGCVPEATPRPFCRKGCYGGQLF